MPYYGYSMETRGRWVKLPDGTFGVKTDGPARRGMVIEVQARSGRIQERRLTQQVGLTSGKLSQRKARTVTTVWNAGTTGRKKCFPALDGTCQSHQSRENPPKRASKTAV